MLAYTVHQRGPVHECFIIIDQQWGMIVWYLNYFCLLFQNWRQMHRIAVLKTFYLTQAKHKNMKSYCHKGQQSLTQLTIDNKQL